MRSTFAKEARGRGEEGHCFLLGKGEWSRIIIRGRPVDGTCTVAGPLVILCGWVSWWLWWGWFAGSVIVPAPSGSLGSKVGWDGGRDWGGPWRQAGRRWSRGGRQGPRCDVSLRSAGARSAVSVATGRLVGEEEEELEFAGLLPGVAMATGEDGHGSSGARRR